MKMERFTVTAKPFTEVSPPFSPFPPKPSRDVSFSSYLRPQAAARSFTSRLHRQTPAEDTEISIFDAEKYFKENPEPKTPETDKIVAKCEFSGIQRVSSVSSVDGYGRSYRNSSFTATPTASSEASWNSQTGLLSRPPGALPVSMKAVPEQKRRRWMFRRKCPCSGKKSVAVDESFSQPPRSSKAEGDDKEGSKMKPMAQASGKLVCNPGRFPPESGFPVEIGCRVVPSGRPFGDVGGFSFPILNPADQTPEEPPRESLEVFQPKVLSEEAAAAVRRSPEFQRRMVGVDVARRSFTFPAKGRVPDDDLASDSSSDLFEIESFSTSATSAFATYRRRESLDEFTRFTTVGGGGLNLNFRRSLDDMTTTASVAPTEIYEPSEVSIEWSVMTADGFDHGSVANFSASASEFGEAAVAAAAAAAAAAEAERSGGGRRRGPGLLSCQCEKAVNVGPHPFPVKCGPELPSRVGQPMLPPTKAKSASVLTRSNSTGMTRAYVIR